jgi:hypothetical protein
VCVCVREREREREREITVFVCHRVRVSKEKYELVANAHRIC